MRVADGEGGGEKHYCMGRVGAYSTTSSQGLFPGDEVVYSKLRAGECCMKLEPFSSKRTKTEGFMEGFSLPSNHLARDFTVKAAKFKTHFKSLA